MKAVKNMKAKSIRSQRQLDLFILENPQTTAQQPTNINTTIITTAPQGHTSNAMNTGNNSSNNGATKQ